MNNMNCRRLHSIGIYCVLLVSALHLVQQVQARFVQDLLPPLVLEDGKQELISNEKKELLQGTIAKADPGISQETSAAVSSNKKEIEQLPEAKFEEKPLISSEASVAPKTEASPEGISTNTSTVTTSQSLPEAKSQPQSAVASEKDIKSLLESKNDAENDLAAAPLAPVSTSSSKKIHDELDPPVDATDNKPADGRYHYAVGSATGAEKPALAPPSESSDSASDDDEDEGDDPEPKKDNPIAELQPSSTSKAITTTVSAVPKSEAQTTTASPLTSTTAQPDVVHTRADKKESSTETTKPSQTNPVSAKEDALHAPVTPIEPKEPEKSPSNDPSVKLADATDKPSAAESDAKKEVVEVKPAKAEAPQPEIAPKDPLPKPRESEPPGLSPSSVSVSTSTTTTPAPSAKSDVSTSSVPVAVAAAAGSALGTAIVNGLTGKANTTQAPLSVASPSSIATTRLPNSRKSTTDKWNRWQPSSIAPSSPPPTRRRPILPSFRRRFRPYNRFSPFPWSGPEPYTPLGSDPDQISGSEPGSSVDSGIVLRPRRRPERPSTIEPTPSSSRYPVSSVTSDDLDSEVPLVTDRRRIQAGSGGRRHQQDRHHSRDRDSDHRNHPHHQADTTPDFGGNSHGTGQRRRMQHGNRHHREQERPTYSLDPFGQRPIGSSFGQPISPGFGLFNSGASSAAGSSGFDLLNPFSWIDEMTKPIRPQHNRPHISQNGRPLGQPALDAGEYGSSSENHHHSHERPSRPHRPGSGTGRDNYYDDHHHDHCHEHDYDHDHDHHHDYDHRPPRRPVRPPFDDRPIYGGGRPDRPPYRRDEEESVGGQFPATRVHSFGDSEPATPEQIDRHHQRHGAKPKSNERVASASHESPTGSAPRRVSSAFSPFDSLFGPIEDELFGSSLRSSFIDAPFKAAADAIRQTNTAFDAIVSSPKISMPAGDTASATSG